MNIFLPFEKNVEQSIQSLDNKRLNKACLETYQLLVSAIKEKNGEKVSGYYHHPIFLHYKDNPEFLAYYGYECCVEYYLRTGKEHKCCRAFEKVLAKVGLVAYDECGFIIAMGVPKFTPYYMEGSKGQPNYIRTTENVSELFQKKLIKKWETDKNNGRPPKWSNREVPKFYQEWLKENGKCI